MKTLRILFGLCLCAGAPHLRSVKPVPRSISRAWKDAEQAFAQRWDILWNEGSRLLQGDDQTLFQEEMIKLHEAVVSHDHDLVQELTGSATAPLTHLLATAPLSTSHAAATTAQELFMIYIPEVLTTYGKIHPYLTSPSTTRSSWSSRAQMWEHTLVQFRRFIDEQLNNKITHQRDLKQTLFRLLDDLHHEIIVEPSFKAHAHILHLEERLSNAVQSSVLRNTSALETIKALVQEGVELLAAHPPKPLPADYDEPAVPTWKGGCPVVP